jgi:two-component system LytT family response regulator
MFNALLIDDEENGRISLRKKLQLYCPEVKLLAEAASAAEGLELIHQQRFDIVFLDIEMPGMDAFEMLSQIDRKDFHLIFTTAHNQYAIEAIKNAAFDYLLKPVDIEELKTSIAKLKEKRQQTTNRADLDMLRQNNAALNRIAIPAMDGLVFLDTADITRAEAQSNYTVLYFLQQPKITVTRTLKQMEQLLPPQLFVRVHHSHIINLAQVKKYFKGSGGQVELKDGTRVDVSRRKKDEFLRLMGY